MKLILDKIIMYLLIFSGLFLLQYYTFGKITSFQDLAVFNVIYLKDLVFIITSIIFIYFFVQIPPSREKS